MDSGFLVDASSGVPGKEQDWTPQRLAVGGLEVAGSGVLEVTVVLIVYVGGRVGGGRKATEGAARQGLSHHRYCLVLPI